MNQKLVRLQFLITIVLYPFSSFKLLRCYEYSLNYFQPFSGYFFPVICHLTAKLPSKKKEKLQTNV